MECVKEIKNENISFIMMKPDGMNNLEMQKELKEQIKTFELDVTETLQISLKGEDIICFWDFYSTCPISTLLLQRYLTGKKLATLVLTGEDAIRKTKKIKAIIRNKYSLSAFSNCIHTPSDMEETMFQLDLLYKKTGRKFFGDDTIKNRRREPQSGIWGRLAKLGDERIKKVSDNIMRKIN